MSVTLMAFNPMLRRPEFTVALQLLPDGNTGCEVVGLNPNGIGFTKAYSAMVYAARMLKRKALAQAGGRRVRPLRKPPCFAVRLEVYSDGEMDCIREGIGSEPEDTAAVASMVGRAARQYGRQLTQYVDKETRA